MHRMAPSPCAFMRSRARSSRYLRMRSQLTRCCQSRPPMPKFAPMNVSPGLPRVSPRWRHRAASSRLPARRSIERTVHAASGRIGARVGLEVGGLDAGDGAFLVVVGGIAGDADCAKNVAGRVADQDTAGHRDEASFTHRSERGEELLLARGAAGKRARAEAHA